MRLILLALLLWPASLQAQDKIAFFGMVMLDDSLQTVELGRDPAELARIETLNEMVTARFIEEGYSFVDLEPARTDIDRYVNLAKCYGCDSRIAEKLGADYSLVGEVQKTSGLILSMNLQLRRAGDGEMVRGGVVDIRGNTDETWERGMRYILKNRIFAEGRP
jgi:hypothetical protein